MARDLGKLAVALPERPPGTHLVARGAAFTVEDCVCRMHARSPVVEHRYRRPAIAVMLGGAFHVRAGEGETLLGPGAMLLKNAASTHAYSHVDDGGDRTLVFEYDDAFLDEVCASYGVHRGRRAFDHLAIPPSAATAAAVVGARRAACGADPEAIRAVAIEVCAAAASADWGRDRRLAAPAPAQVSRVARTLRHVDAHLAEDCSLDTLSALAGLSSFHFARVFRALTGQTPRQYVIAARLRAAAAALHATRKPITDIALDAGFGDLSHFTTSFRRAFGVSPGRYRRGLAPRA